MARGVGRFRGGGIPAPKRQINNAAFSGEVDGVTTIVGIVKALGSDALQTAAGALTIVRTRGSLTVRAAAAAAGDSLIRGAMGIIQVSADAFGVGVTAVPGPLTDDGSDWYVWVPITLAFDNTLTEFDSKYIHSVNFDSRGMRKSKVGETSVVVFEFQSDVAGNSIDASYSIREQAKL